MADTKGQGSGAGGAEQRQAVRKVVDYDLRVSVGKGHEFFTGLVKNISQGGIFVETLQPHETGESITLRFAFAGSEQPVEVEGIVRWRRDTASPLGKPGIGIQLLDLPAGICDDINRYIEDKDVLMYE